MAYQRQGMGAGESKRLLHPSPPPFPVLLEIATSCVACVCVWRLNPTPPGKAAQTRRRASPPPLIPLTTTTTLCAPLTCACQAYLQRFYGQPLAAPSPPHPHSLFTLSSPPSLPSLVVGPVFALHPGRGSQAHMSAACQHISNATLDNPHSLVVHHPIPHPHLLSAQYLPVTPSTSGEEAR